MKAALASIIVVASGACRGEVASWYDAPHRGTFASRHREWRGHTFIISAGHRRVRATCADYGPMRWTRRDIDVSRDVAKHLGFLRRGVATVTLRRSH